MSSCKYSTQGEMMCPKQEQTQANVPVAPPVIVNEPSNIVCKSSEENLRDKTSKMIFDYYIQPQNIIPYTDGSCLFE